MSRLFHHFMLVVILIVPILFSACAREGDETAGVERYNRGVALLEAGDYKGAIVEFEATLRADPGFFEAKKNLAGAFVEERNWQEARRHYVEAMRIRPNDPSIPANLAHVYQQLGEYQLAQDMVEAALGKDPTYPLAHFRAGELLLARGFEEDAIAAFSDCIRYETGSRLAYEAESIIDSVQFDGAGEESPGTEIIEQPVEEEVEEEPEEVEEEPDPAKEEEVEEEAEEEAETEEEAVEEEEQVEEEAPEIEEEPEEEEPEVEEEEPEIEEEEQEEPVIEEPELPELTGDELYQDRLRRGRQMRVIGSTAAAIRLLLEAYGVHPDYAQVNYELGLAYLADGQTVQGRYHLERYLELETDPAARAEVEARLSAIEAALEEVVVVEAETEEEGGEEEEAEGEQETEAEEDSGEEEEEEEEEEERSWFF